MERSTHSIVSTPDVECDVGLELNLLPEFEKIIFRRLSVFVGLFSLKAARAIVADDQITEEQVVAVLADLVAKSLVTPVIDAAPLRYRLLDMTRAYLLTKPIETRRRH